MGCLTVQVFVVSIIVPATQSQDADIRLLKGIKDTIIATTDAMQLTVHILELLLHLRVRCWVLRQHPYLLHHLMHLFWW